MICSVEGCTSAYRIKRGWCNAHYTRWRKHGDPLTTRAPRHGVGDRIGGLVLVGRPHGAERRWLARCDCGNEFRVYTGNAQRRAGTCGDLAKHPALAGADHPRWAEVPTYSGMHLRLRRELGLAIERECADCGRHADEWSYDHGDPDVVFEKGLPYSLKLHHYKPRCKTWPRGTRQQKGAGRMSADFYGRQGRNFAQDHSKDSVCKPDYQGYCPCPLEEAATDVAELVCSDTLVTSRSHPMHAPVIDIDFPAQLLPSATPGHFHLYLDKPCSWQEYLDVLKAMAKAGLVQWGFVNTTEERGYGSLRHPDRPKEITT